MKLLSTNLAGLLLLSLPATAAVAPMDFLPGPLVEWPMSAGGNGHVYQAVETSLGINWIDAQTWAAAHGGYLANLGSAQENDFVYALIKDVKFWTATRSGSFKGPWLGGIKSPTSTRPDEGWHWGNGTAFTYTNWAPNEPDNSKGRENRLNYYATGQSIPQPTWNDQAYDDTAPGFVVEYEIKPPAGFTTDVPQLQIPLLIATFFSALIFLAGLFVFFFRQPRPEDDDSDDPPAPTPPAQT
jgi:hypothetical protein